MSTGLKVLAKAIAKMKSHIIGRWDTEDLVEIIRRTRSGWVVHIAAVVW